MACYVCHYKKLNCTEGCPFARFFDEGNISTYDKISISLRHHVLKERLRPCSMEEGRRVIDQCLMEAEARIPHLDLCNPCRFLEAYDCKGERCDLRQHFGTESGLAKLKAIVNLKTKKFFLSNFRKAGGKKAARVDAWYSEAVRASTAEVPAYEEDKVSFNRVKEAMGADWVRNEFRAFVIEITTKAADAAQAAAQGAEEEVEEEVEAEAVAEEEVEPEAIAEGEVVEPEAVTVEAEVANALLLLRPPPAEEEVEPEAVAASTPLLLPAPEAVAASTPLLLPAPAGRSRRRASILAEQRVAAIYKKEEEEDKKEEEEDNEDKD